MNYLIALVVFLQEEAPRDNSGGWIFVLIVIAALLIVGAVIVGAGVLLARTIKTFI